MDVDLTPRMLGRSPASTAEKSGLRDVSELYARLDAEIASHHPVCTNRGDCCKFDAYGHRLYVTTVELEHFVARQRPLGLRPVTTGSCPYQVEGRCTARDHRPLGCRVFFCDPNAQAWQPALYEKYLAELKRLGQQYGVAYRYAEWLTLLREVSSA